MPRKTIGATRAAGTALLLGCFCALPGWSELTGPALELGVAGQTALTRESRFPLKAQAAGAVSARGEAAIGSVAALGLGVEAHDTLGSSLSGGWQYRGHLGGALELYGRLRWPLRTGRTPRAAYLGAASGMSFNVDRYTYTQLYFFFPGWFVEPQLELQLHRGGRSGLGITLPIDVYFRKDLELSVALGLGLSWRLYRKEVP